MWLLIPEGFYSIVYKPGEAELCVRARVSGDLDRLREAYLPSLSQTLETPGGDYRFRAWIGRDELAEGMAEVAHNVDYGNLKTEIALHDPERARIYGHVWGVLGQLQPGGPYSD